jgi:hypothetical protein
VPIRLSTSAKIFLGLRFPINDHDTVLCPCITTLLSSLRLDPSGQYFQLHATRCFQTNLSPLLLLGFYYWPPLCLVLMVAVAPGALPWPHLSLPFLPKYVQSIYHPCFSLGRRRCPPPLQQPAPPTLRATSGSSNPPPSRSTAPHASVASPPTRCLLRLVASRCLLPPPTSPAPSPTVLVASPSTHRLP